jgi:hypothetical protein
MKYAVLIYGSDEMEAGDAAITAEYMALAERKATFGGAELDHPATATTVRVQNGDVLTSDGPFAETKEVLFSFYILNLENLDEATKWAQRMPAAQYGSVTIHATVNLEFA